MASIRDATECDRCTKEKTTVTERGTPEGYDGGDWLCLGCRKDVWEEHGLDSADAPDGDR